MSSAAATARPAPSVAVTKPPKMPPRMMTGSRKAQDASFSVRQTRDELKFLLDREIVAHRLDIGGDGQAEGADDAGQDAGDEHFDH